MTLGDIKKKTLSLIEEIDNSETSLTKDPDIAAKLNYVINQVQNELSRVKKIPDYTELEVNEGDLIRFDDITSDYQIYQLDIARGIKYEYKAQGTIIKCLEAGTLEVEYFRYPEEINDLTKDNFEFELSNDVLEIMPYGVAADLLKSDVSNAYGNVYAQRYENMKNQLDIRYNTGAIEFEGDMNGTSKWKFNN